MTRAALARDKKSNDDKSKVMVKKFYGAYAVSQPEAMEEMS